MSVLGIDLGTTSVKLTLFDEKKQEVIETASQSANAYVESDFSEQDVNLIWLSLETLLASFGAEKLCDVRRVAVCCQMHGVVLWRKRSCVEAPLEVSHLITWEDQRCDEVFLRSLPVSKFQKICTGESCIPVLCFHLHYWCLTYVMLVLSSSFVFERVSFRGLPKSLYMPYVEESWLNIQFRFWNEMRVDARDRMDRRMKEKIIIGWVIKLNVEDIFHLPL